MVSRSAGVGNWSCSASTSPRLTTWLTTSMPHSWRRKARATVPTATRAAVSRALARSNTGRASEKPYFCMPGRSACPGRGLVNGSLRPSPANTSGSTGSAAMTCSHLGHSLFPIRIATGPPWVRPCRTPPITSSSSASKFIRGLRPNPSLRRSSWVATSSVVTSTPATMPSSTATRAGPCDSPAVIQRSTTLDPATLGRSWWRPGWASTLSTQPNQVRAFGARHRRTAPPLASLARAQRLGEPAHATYRRACGFGDDSAFWTATTRRPSRPRPGRAWRARAAPRADGGTRVNR